MTNVDPITEPVAADSAAASELTVNSTEPETTAKITEPEIIVNSTTTETAMETITDLIYSEWADVIVEAYEEKPIKKKEFKPKYWNLDEPDEPIEETPSEEGSDISIISVPVVELETTITTSVPAASRPPAKETKETKEETKETTETTEGEDAETDTVETEIFRYRFHVLGPLLSMVSPFWKRSLDDNTPFKGLETREVNGRKMKILPFFDTNIESLKFLFRILHHKQTKEIAHMLPVNDLYDLALIVDRYQCKDFLIPWVEGWFFARYPGSASHSVSIPETGVIGHMNWFKIGLVFKDVSGMSDMTIVLSKAIARQTGGFQGEDKSTFTCLVDEEHPDQVYVPANWESDSRQYEELSKQTLKTTCIPDMILAHIMEQQAGAVQQVDDLLKPFFQELTGNPPEGTESLCRNHVCTDMAFGTLYRGVKGTFLEPYLMDPLNASLPKDMSIFGLHRLIKKLQMATMVFYDGCNCCNPGHNNNMTMRKSDLADKMTNMTIGPVAWSQEDVDGKADETTQKVCPRATKLLEIQKLAAKLYDDVLGYGEVRPEPEKEETPEPTTEAAADGADAAAPAANDG